MYSRPGDHGGCLTKTLSSVGTVCFAFNALTVNLIHGGTSVVAAELSPQLIPGMKMDGGGDVDLHFTDGDLD